MRKEIVTCDKCKEVINSGELTFNAGAYGFEAHLNCVRMMTAFELVAGLSLDDIKVMPLDDWDNSKKADSYVRRSEGISI